MFPAEPLSSPLRGDSAPLIDAIQLTAIRRERAGPDGQCESTLTLKAEQKEI